MKKQALFFFTILFTYVLVSCQNKKIDKISLAGEWTLTLDRSDVGIKEAWYNKKFEQKIKLPGSLPENGIGDAPSIATRWMGYIEDSTFYKSQRMAKYRTPNNFKLPFFLTPNKYYRGVAWYQRRIDIPADWDNQSIELFLERCHWETKVWIDDKMIGSRDALATPHIYDIKNIKAGSHTLTIRVSNELIVDVGINSHSISDQTQSNWNGIIGAIELRALPENQINSVKIFPDVEKSRVEIQVKTKNRSTQPFTGKLTTSIVTPNKVLLPKIITNISSAISTDSIFISHDLSEKLELWNEFTPALYKLKVTLVDNHGNLIDSLTKSFGMRKIAAKGKRLELNGAPMFLRGTLDCAIFPLTGYPAMTVGYWKKIFSTARAYGLNHIRYHSWCPPEAAFAVADSMGFYLQIECGSWANPIGDGTPVDNFILKESERIVESYGNHPSFCLMTYGNEPAGRNMVTFLGNFVSKWKSRDPRRLYTSGAGWPTLPQNDYHCIPRPRIQGYGEGLNSIINAQPPTTNFDWADRIKELDKPVVSHEIGAWSSYPNLDEIKKYTGVLKAKSFEIFKETLEENQLGRLFKSYLSASGKLQTLCYKADIEAALRTSEFGGFQLLSLQDFPGQGTAPVGVVDAFWEPKGYVSGEQFRRFCSETVPLARIPKLILQNKEVFKAEIEIAHYGPKPFSDAVVYWKLQSLDGAKVIDEGIWKTTLPTGGVFKVGKLSRPLQDIEVPTGLKLIVGIAKTNYENNWDLWIYPSKPSIQQRNNIVVTSSWDEASGALTHGRNVLFLLKAEKLRRQAGGDISVGFSSLFWDTSWTLNQAPHTLGILCEPTNPALQGFPTEFHSNWQWWELVTGSHAMMLDSLPPTINPIIRLIDDWSKNRKLALLFEAKIKAGKLVMCSMDLTHIQNRPVARQLCESILEYMDSEKFNPNIKIEEKDIFKLILK